MAETTGAARAATLKGTVNVRVNENVTLENLHNIVNHIVGMTGCRACGLLGVDLILGGDPAELQQVAKLPGVQSTSFSA
jgi:microsomal dipeptidase-like Zn-dependent dipeptidase